MLLKIIRYIKGYIRIRVIGYSAERFLNACSHKGIFLWGLKPVGGAYEMNITIKGFRQLKPIIRKTGTKVVIVRRFGLPFFLHKYRKRKLFFGGAFLFVVMIIAMSRFIWNIDITGNQSRTDESILEFLGSKNVEDGMPKSDVDCARIVKDIRKEYDDIIWVSASIKGTRLIIQVKENEDSLPVVNKTEEEKEQEARENATDIVADQECVITDIVPRKGIAMVKEGDQVKKGDILISGQVPVNNDAGETIAYQYHESDADIRDRRPLRTKTARRLCIWKRNIWTYRRKNTILGSETDFSDWLQSRTSMRNGRCIPRSGSFGLARIFTCLYPMAFGLPILTVPKRRSIQRRNSSRS